MLQGGNYASRLQHVQQEHSVAASSVKPILIPHAVNTNAGAPSVLIISQAALKPLGLLPLDFCSTCHHATDTDASLAASSCLHKIDHAEQHICDWVHSTEAKLY